MHAPLAAISLLALAAALGVSSVAGASSSQPGLSPTNGA